MKPLSLTSNTKKIIPVPPFDGGICLIGALMTMRKTGHPMAIGDKVSL